MTSAAHDSASSFYERSALRVPARTSGEQTDFVIQAESLKPVKRVEQRQGVQRRNPFMRERHHDCNETMQSQKLRVGYNFCYDCETALIRE